MGEEKGEMVKAQVDKDSNDVIEDTYGNDSFVPTNENN